MSLINSAGRFEWWFSDHVEIKWWMQIIVLGMKSKYCVIDREGCTIVVNKLMHGCANVVPT